MPLALFVAIFFAFAGLSDAEMRDVLAGQVPVRSESFVNARGKSAGRGLGAVVIYRPVADVWATLCRYEDRAEYIPRLKSVAVLERQPGRLRVRQEIDATVMTARYTAWFNLDEAALTISWSLDKSATDNTIAEADGEYRMMALDPGRTLLVYRTYVDSGLKVPQSIQSYMQRRSIPDLLKNIKKRVESGGTWRR
jgi:carbon monoxide dehydrogenase subunit G